MANTSTSTPTLTIGIDLGDRFSYYCVLDADGAIVEQSRLSTVPLAFVKRFGKTELARIVIEAGTNSPWVADCLEEAGHEVLVANAGKLRFIFMNDNKSDRTDAELLARVARVDPLLLSPIQHRTKKTRAHLSILRARKCLVTSRTQLINHVRGAMKSFGIRLLKCSTPSFAKRMLEEIPDELRPALVPLLTMIQTHSADIRSYERQLETLAKEQYPVTELLRQVNGVGPLTSLAYVLTLEDHRRFKDSRSVGAYLGLRPKRDQSGDHNPELRITKAGDGNLRSLLVQSAQYILGPFGKESDLRSFGLAIAARGSKVMKRKAVIAVARKLSVLLHSLWRTGEVYEPLRNTPPESATPAIVAAAS